MWKRIVEALGKILPRGSQDQVILPPESDEKKPKKLYRIRIMPLNVKATDVVKETKRSIAILFYAEKMSKDEKAEKLKHLKVFLGNHGFRLYGISPKWFIAVKSTIEVGKGK